MFTLLKLILTSIGNLKLKLSANTKKTVTNSLLYASFFLNIPLDLVHDDYDKTKRVALQPTPYEIGADAFKTPKDVKTFLSDNRVSDDFVVSHEQYLISASHIFEIPYAFQTCLIYSESKFKPEAVSPVGARGVAQFTKDTYDFIDKVLRVGYKNLEDLSDNRIAYGFETRPKSKYVLFNKILFSELYIKWQAYVSNNNIKSIPFNSNRFKRVVHDPKYAIGMSSLYLKYLKERLRFNLKSQYNYSEGPLNPNIYLSLAGAYNQGIGRTWKLSSRNKDVDLKYIIDFQSRVRETKTYIKSINGCMSSYQ